jgi:4'-phosphopantetheinyl transferase
MPAVGVDIWTVGLRVSSVELARRRDLLSDQERARADRFHFAKDREAHIAAHGALRLILAKHLNCPAAEILFKEGTNGKPAVAGLRFNLSHSANLGLVAVTSDRELGVDVEHIDPHRADVSVAHRFFSPSEASALEALPPEQQTVAFLNCWTRKEAYLKAIGLGLSVPLDSFDVSLAPGEPARLLRGADPKWQLHSFVPAPEYLGALAVDAAGHEVVIELRSFEHD